MQGLSAAVSKHHLKLAPPPQLGGVGGGAGLGVIDESEQLYLEQSSESEK